MSHRKRQLPTENIYQAVFESNHELLKRLLFAKTFYDSNDNGLHATALDIAVEKDDYTAAKLLLDYAAFPDHMLSDRSTRQWRQKDFIDPEVLLHDSDFITKIFDDCLIEHPSVLYWAIAVRNHDIIKLLIDRGCNPDFYLECWYNVVQQDDLSIFKLLMERTGREVGNNRWCQEIMLTACGIGSNNIVFHLIDEGVPVDIQLHGLTGAFKALIGNHTYTFMQLVERGANLQFTDSNGLSLLHAAGFRASLVPIRFLLDNGLDVNIRDMYNRTPLHYIAQYLVIEFDFNVLDLLMSHGADINAIDILGQTPMMKAINSSSYNINNIYRLLQQKDMDFVKQDNEGHSVLHHLIIKDIISIESDPLLRPEIDLNARNKKNMTLLQYAIRYSSSLYFQILLDLGDETEGLIEFSDTLVSSKEFITVLARFRAKRRIAGFNEDKNIDFILSKQKILDLGTLTCISNPEIFEQQIEIMKNEKLFGQINYFNFLHAKKRTCVAIAKRPELREIFFSKTHEFYDYYYMLAKKYVNGLKPFTKLESQALMLAEDNISIISNYSLPSTVTYKIKKYIEIEDMVTLLNMNLFESNDNDDVKL